VPIMRSRGPSVVPRTSVFVPQGSRRYRPAVTGRERDWLRRQIDAARRLRVAYLEEHGRPPSARPCPVCLVGELNGNPRQRYCSPRCKNRARKRRNHEALLAEVRARTCEVCGEPLATRVSQRARALLLEALLERGRSPPASSAAALSRLSSAIVLVSRSSSSSSESRTSRSSSGEYQTPNATGRESGRS
jgi:hypothetical protein